MELHSFLIHDLDFPGNGIQILPEGGDWIVECEEGEMDCLRCVSIISHKISPESKLKFFCFFPTLFFFLPGKIACRVGESGVVKVTTGTRL